MIYQEAYPFSPNHPFRPKKADLDDLLGFEKQLGIDHVALVAISVYGDDNALLLQRLRELNGRGRGVVSIDPENVSSAELDDMHAIGVRGVRMNLKSRLETLKEATMKSKLFRYADTVRRLNWSLHLHIGLAEITKISDVVPHLGVDVVLDHMASPKTTEEAKAQKGYVELINLLADRSVFVKLSGLYRFEGMPGMDEYVKEVLSTAPTQVIWASDWPHTGGANCNPGGNRKRIQDYRTVDVPAFIEKCLFWCGGDETLMHKILVENPRRLWRYY